MNHIRHLFSQQWITHSIGTIREWSREEREYTVIPQAFKPRDATERRGDPDAEGGGIPEARGGIPRFEGLRDDRMFPNFEASFMNCHYLSKADCHKHLYLQYILVIRSAKINFIWDMGTQNIIGQT